MRLFLVLAMVTLVAFNSNALRKDPTADVNFELNNGAVLGDVFIFLDANEPWGLYTLRNISALYDVPGIRVTVFANKGINAEDKKEIFEEAFALRQRIDETPTLMSDEEKTMLRRAMIDFNIVDDSTGEAAGFFDLDAKPVAVYAPLIDYREPNFKFDIATSAGLKALLKEIAYYNAHSDDDKYQPDLTKDFHYCDYNPEAEQCKGDEHSGHNHEMH